MWTFKDSSTFGFSQTICTVASVEFTSYTWSIRYKLLWYYDIILDILCYIDIIFDYKDKYFTSLTSSQYNSLCIHAFIKVTLPCLILAVEALHLSSLKKTLLSLLVKCTLETSSTYTRKWPLMYKERNCFWVFLHNTLWAIGKVSKVCGKGIESESPWWVLRVR